MKILRFVMAVSGCMVLMVSLMVFSPAASAADTTEIIVRALGSTGAENLKVKVNGAWVDDDLIIAVNNKADSGHESVNYVSYPLEYSGPVDDVSVHFINNGYHNNMDMNVKIDYISVDGVKYHSEVPSVESLGVWNGTDCSPGKRNAEWLHCNGWFKYQIDTPADSAGSTAPSNPPNEEVAAPVDPVEPVATGRRRLNNMPVLEYNEWSWTDQIEILSTGSATNISSSLDFKLPKDAAIYMADTEFCGNISNPARAVMNNGIEHTNANVLSENIESGVAYASPDSYWRIGCIGSKYVEREDAYVGAWLWMPSKVIHGDLSSYHSAPDKQAVAACVAYLMGDEQTSPKCYEDGVTWRVDEIIRQMCYDTNSASCSKALNVVNNGGSRGKRYNSNGYELLDSFSWPSSTKFTIGNKGALNLISAGGPKNSSIAINLPPHTASYSTTSDSCVNPPYAGNVSGVDQIENGSAVVGSPDGYWWRFMCASNGYEDIVQYHEAAHLWQPIVLGLQEFRAGAKEENKLSGIHLVEVQAGCVGLAFGEEHGPMGRDKALIPHCDDDHVAPVVKQLISRMCSGINEPHCAQAKEHVGL